MISPADYQLLDRYRTGECTADERSRVQELLATDVHVGELIAWMKMLESAAEQLPDTASHEAADGLNVDVVWTKLASELAATTVRDAVPDTHPVDQPGTRRTPVLRFASHRSRSIWSSWGLRVAAVAVIGVGSVLFAREKRLDAERLRASKAAPVAMRTYATRPGQRADVQLVDGSRVLLGVNSTLRVPEDYNERSRDLYVDGDAYFDVVHDSQKVFRVHARNTVTQDVGTKFAVRAYSTDTTVSIVVAEGSVTVKPHGPNVQQGEMSPDAIPTATLLGPRDMLCVSSNGDTEVRHGVDISYYLAWTHGRLEFRNAPLSAVAVQLSRWYDINIRLGDPAIGSRHITMSLDTESVAEMVSLLEASLNLQARQSGRSVVLFAR